MKRLLLLPLVALSLHAHNDALYERYYDYYTLGYSYASNSENSASEAMQVCHKKTDFAHRDGNYLRSCKLGIKHATDGKTEAKYRDFLREIEHKH